MPEKATEWWYEKAADSMVREGKNLFLFSNENDLGLTQRECENVLRTKLFQEVLRTHRNVYYKEVANDPSLSRAAIKGQMVLAITKMFEAGLWEKACNAAMQLAKLEGWTTDGSNVNIFQEFTQKDIDAMKAKFTAAVPSKTAN